MVLLGAFCGLRPGELRAVTLDSVNPLQKRITVRATLSEVSGEVEFGPTKTGTVRSLSMPGFLAQAIQEHLTRFGSGVNDPIFTAPLGGPIRKNNFRRRVWLPAVDSPIGGSCRVHDLRHTNAALLIEQNQHPKVIQERLGHTSIKTTLDRYGHLFDGLDEAAADQLDAAYGHAPVGFSWG